MKVPGSTDRRVLRTHATLREALLALLVTTPWDDISVQDICDRANVGRSTFYVHFADKEDLLLSGFADLRSALRGQVQAQVTGNGLGFAHGLFAHAFENQRIFRALVGKRSGEAVHKLFRQLVIELTHDELAPHLTPHHLEPTVHYIAGAFVGLLTWWLDARRPLSVDEIEARFQLLTAPALRAARRADTAS